MGGECDGPVSFLLSRNGRSERFLADSRTSRTYSRAAEVSRGMSSVPRPGRIMPRGLPSAAGVPSVNRAWMCSDPTVQFSSVRDREANVETENGNCRERSVPNAPPNAPIHRRLIYLPDVRHGHLPRGRQAASNLSPRRHPTSRSGEPPVVMSGRTSFPYPQFARSMSKSRPSITPSPFKSAPGTFIVGFTSTPRPLTGLH